MGGVMPGVFLGHGNPMNAIQSNAYTEGWRLLGESIPKPQAILAISAHWYGPDMAVSGSVSPETMHDFYGFPRELFEVTWPAPGSPELAGRVRELLRPNDVRFDAHRGLDHGAWAVLCHLYPKADIPVVQLSIDNRKPPRFHYEIGRLLQPLREEGVLVVGSGNIVHNLGAYDWENENSAPFDWALRFESTITQLMLEGKDIEVADYALHGEDARLSVPSPDHFLPLLYVLGLRKENEKVSFPVEGIVGGALSMLSVRVG